MSAADAVFAEHGTRGEGIRRWLRLALVVFFVAVLLTEPPAEHLVACWLLVACYLTWTLAIHVLAGRTPLAGPTWLALAIDVAVLALLTLITDTTAAVSWTPYLIINGFFLIPVMAATQLRPMLCAAVVAPTVLIYLASGLITQDVGQEPTSYVLLRTLVLAAVGLGAVLLTRLQRARVTTIAALLQDRTALLSDLVEIERREQRTLAEALHDGALQYLLGARLELDDVAAGDAEALRRVDDALAESARLLRITTTQLHPAVLQAAGLLPVVRDLIETVRARGRFTLTLTTDGWADGDRTSADELLLSVLRELLNNVVKHARATSVQVSLSRVDDSVELRVGDDGVGLDGVDLDDRLGEGHLGLASLRVRIRAAGGQLRLSAGAPHGTVVEVTLPAAQQVG